MATFSHPKITMLMLGGAALALAGCADGAGSSGGSYGGSSSSSSYGSGTSSYGSSYGSGAAKTTPAPTIGGSEVITVQIKGFAFEPASLSVKVGQTLQFVNMDSAPHTATASSGAFDTGQLGNGQSGSITITEAGSYEYFCAVHPSMKGMIVAQ